MFHRWIKQHALPELTIDVANYAHVPKGPGVVLIGHGSDYFMDEGEGRLGLLHNRKRAGLAPGERLADLARRTLHAAALLERDLALTRQGPLRDRRAAVPDQRPPRRAQHRRDVRRRCGPSWRRWRKSSSAAPCELARVGGRQGAVRGAHHSDDQRRRWRRCSSAPAGRPPRTRRW